MRRTIEIINYRYTQKEFIAVCLLVLAGIGRVIAPEQILLSIAACGIAIVTSLWYPATWCSAFLFLFLLPHIMQIEGVTRPVGISLFSVLPLVVMKMVAQERINKYLPNYKVLCAVTIIIIAIFLSSIFANYENNISDTMYRLCCITIALINILTLRNDKDRAVSYFFISFSSVLLSIHVIKYGLENNIFMLHDQKDYLGSGDANVATFYILTGMALLCAIALRKENKKVVRFISIVFTVVCSFALLLLASRMGTVILCALVITIMIYKREANHVMRIIRNVMLILIILLGVQLAKTDGVMEDYLKRWQNKEEIIDLGARRTIAINALAYLREADMFDIVVGGGAMHNYKVLSGANTHNAYLEYWIDHGLIAILGLIMLLCQAWKNVSKENDLLKIAGRGTLVVLILGSFSLSPFVLPWSWIALSTCLAIRSPKIRIWDNIKLIEDHKVL